MPNTSWEINVKRRDYLKMAGLGMAAVALPLWMRAADAGSNPARKPNSLVIIAERTMRGHHRMALA